MKTSSVALLLLAPVAASAAGELTAQEPTRPYEARECGRIGIAFAGTDPLVVGQLMPGSPAERAGIQPNDTVLAVDGARITQDLLASLPKRLTPGERVRLLLRRDGLVRVATVVPARDVCIHVAATGGGRPDPTTDLRPDIVFFRTEPHALNPWLPRSTPSSADARDVVAGLRRQEATLDSLMLRMRAEERQWLDSLRRRLIDGAAHQERLARELVAARAGAGARAPVYGTILRAAPGAAEPSAAAYVGRHAIAGVEFTELNPQLAAYFRGARDGLLVLRVAPGTPGERIGFQPGDVVVAADGEPVRGIADLRLAIARAGREPIAFAIVRRGEERRLVYRQGG